MKRRLRVCNHYFMQVKCKIDNEFSYSSFYYLNEMQTKQRYLLSTILYEKGFVLRDDFDE
jgi:hypothetical protein